jgi:hypothetical protein
MKSYQKKKLDKLLIENQLDKIKNTKADPDNIILNAAAFQQDLIREMGLNKKKLNFPRKKKQKDIEREIKAEYEEDKIHVFLPKIINKTINEEKDSSVISRRRQFLNNLSLAQKVGLKQIPKMPLSLQEWKNIEDKTVLRNDHTSNCPICLEALSKRESMILSCTHIFHKVNIN